MQNTKGKGLQMLCVRNSYLKNQWEFLKKSSSMSSSNNTFKFQKSDNGLHLQRLLMRKKKKGKQEAVKKDGHLVLDKK